MSRIFGPRYTRGRGYTRDPAYTWVPGMLSVADIPAMPGKQVTGLAHTVETDVEAVETPAGNHWVLGAQAAPVLLQTFPAKNTQQNTPLWKEMQADAAAPS